MRPLLAVLVAASVSLVALPSFAQGTPPAAPSYRETRVEGGSVVAFPDDLMSGAGANPLGDTIRRPPGAIRVGLIQPRYNFLSELLKSVENL